MIVKYMHLHIDKIKNPNDIEKVLIYLNAFFIVSFNTLSKSLHVWIGFIAVTRAIKCCSVFFFFYLPSFLCKDGIFLIVFSNLSDMS